MRKLTLRMPVYARLSEPRLASLAWRAAAPIGFVAINHQGFMFHNPIDFSTDVTVSPNRDGSGGISSGDGFKFFEKQKMPLRNANVKPTYYNYEF